ncbi:ERF family protein [Lysinibacillus sp. NPDC058147]|uniref:ERF family protein n=1 Tax=unclassified Lysinibacillus TaxID=2636778 RepID=UPI0036DF2AA9
MIFSQENTNIATALAKSWGELETPKHNATVKVSLKSGGSYSFDYTDLNGIFEAARKVFKENGISVIQNSYTESTERGPLACVETMFLHSSGEWVKSLPLKFPAATGMQDFGGQITYMKRYSLSAMLGIATEKDDDANGASGNTYDYSSRQQGGSSQQSNNNNIPMPTNAQEASAITLSFGKHQGKTLKQIWREDMSYIQWLANGDKTDAAIREGIGMMQVAAAQQEAQQKMQQQAV